jgi:predicted ATP-grasp superfamily ATP-dependent carboligase
MTKPLPYVVLRSNDVCFLGCLRSLAAAGAESIPVTFTWPGAGPWYSEASRHFRDPIVIANPFAETRRAADQFIEAGKRLTDKLGDRPLAIPSSDTNLMFLLDHYEEFEPYYRMMGAKDFGAARMDVVRKDTCSELLERGGVALPKTRACLSSADIERVVAEMVFPCVYKPLKKDYGQSFYRAHGGSKAVTCESPEALRAGLRVEMERGFELVVQERVFFDSVYDEIPCYVYVDAEHPRAHVVDGHQGEDSALSLRHRHGAALLLAPGAPRRSLPGCEGA